MNLGKYINRLAREHEIVIVPDFGAFIAEYKPAQIDDASGKISPPSKKIIFDPKIKNNDGLLQREIAFKEKVTEEEALNTIEQEVDDILYRLDKGEKVLIENTGVVYFDETGKIKFEHSAEDNLLPESFGLESASLLYKTEDTDYQKENKAQEYTKNDIRAEEAETKASNEHDIFPEAGIHTFPSYSGFENKNGEKPTGDRRKGWFWLLIISVIIVAAGIYAWNYFKNQIPSSTEIIAEPPATDEIRQTDPAADQQNTGIADSIKSDSVMTSLTDTLKNEQKVDTAAYTIPDPSKYYLVGGSFTDPENAQKYIQQMKKKGFEPFHLGKHGSFYIIALQTYDNEIEAFGAQYNFLDKDPDSGVWIFIPEEEQK